VAPAEGAPELTFRRLGSRPAARVCRIGVSVSLVAVPGAVSVAVHADALSPPLPRLSSQGAQELYEAYGWFVAAFREAADKLKAGDRTARFPVGSFSPHLPFVSDQPPRGLIPGPA